MAGHSKWANIQHRKGRQDAVRSKLFSKFSKEITVAAKLGDPDPEKNPRLRLAVKEAKNNSVPKDLIERAIKKSIGDDQNHYEEIRYEGFAPYGIAIIIETLTDNKNRTASNIRSIFSKNNGSLGETGSVSYMFKKLGRIIYSSKVADYESFFEISLENDVEDVYDNEQNYTIYCQAEKLHNISHSLEKSFGEPSSEKLIWKPNEFIELNKEESNTILKIIESLEEFEDTQNIFTNLKSY